ncbi:MULTISPECIES: NADH:flavin oxidoreductase [unclassified Sphingobium]|uniref:NADH:flavin oxidoreductase n=1 Tax=unclassified Sphingobium TaxID=2611147 RepID=UPI000D158A0F|nr:MULTISPECIES: NADH:flavin oxidoreductase [unclassified Sphingobium]MBG6120003.1 2,4-dienoyl-CoA reductase-like NADH-dependent reductase (Old Yellow Enzyme family) [Sphingobium sp. JAI105]PSO12936.1 12-oxophytodienoate reductase [Sphingobium sp. AEW4]TWD05796.1 2,4-dienoyl-CoA reductase-like NADH-dependent reductase (Old Yellow Enzyme family) [Sphingobium sp. AEW010]TWD23349.1 2,4-dienoyl-CoA reductase-like NADH-dependent reductase (Old Yellow Enzyme family) [Sphingobium sp. AEW013]TWD25209.
MPDILYQPLALRAVTLANRAVMSPMSRYFAKEGVPGADVAGYYARRAEAGVGLIMTEGVSIAHPVATDNPGVPHLHGDAALAGWKAVVDQVHAHGCPIFPQLWHQGPMWNVEHTAGGDDVAALSALRPSGIWGPADGTISLRPNAREKSLEPTRAMSEEEIADVIAAYATSAANAKAVGFDGIAIHGAHGYLIDSFLWSYTNRRTDRWGGDHRQRASFGAEVVRAIRRAIGDDMPIMLRISQFKMQDYKARLADTPDELAMLLQPLVEAGVDAFDCSQRFFDTPLFAGSTLNLAGWVRKLGGVPSMAVGGVGLDKGAGTALHIDQSQHAANNIGPALARMERGEFDLLAIGRSLLNDPRWFARLRSGEGFLPFDPENLKRLT